MQYLACQLRELQNKIGQIMWNYPIDLTKLIDWDNRQKF